MSEKRERVDLLLRCSGPSTTSPRQAPPVCSKTRLLWRRAFFLSKTDTFYDFVIKSSSEGENQTDMAEVDPASAGAVEEEEFEKPDPILKAPDLYQAAKDNDTAKVLELLKEEVPPFYVEKKTEWTSLHWASLHGNAKVVKGLLAAKASEKYHKQVKKWKKTNGIVDTASISIDSEEFEEEEADNEVHSKINYMKNTPLLWASFKGHMQTVWLLLVDGYSPNDVDDLGNNALHLAAASGHKKVLQALIDDGAMPTALNIYKNPAINMATGVHVLCSVTIKNDRF